MREVMTIAARGRKPDGKSEYTQSWEANSSEYTNTLTSVAKDNYICEKEAFCLQYVRNDYGRMIRKGYEAGDFRRGEAKSEKSFRGLTG